MSKNIIEVDPAKFPWLDLNRYTFCMGAENAGILYLSGQTASEYDPQQGRVACKGDLLDQTRVIYEKLAVVLEAAGMGFDNVVQTVDYIDATALPQYRQTGEIRKQYLKDSPVGATGIVIERLLRPDAFIEVAVNAAQPQTPLGMAIISLRDELFNHDPSAHLEVLVVNAEARGVLTPRFPNSGTGLCIVRTVPKTTGRTQDENPRNYRA